MMDRYRVVYDLEGGYWSERTFNENGRQLTFKDNTGYWG